MRYYDVYENPYYFFYSHYLRDDAEYEVNVAREFSSSVNLMYSESWALNVEWKLKSESEAWRKNKDNIIGM